MAFVQRARELAHDPVAGLLGRGARFHGPFEVVGHLARLRQLRGVVLWQRERGFTFWPAERRADGALLGFCGIKIADQAGSPIEGVHEVGWRLREDVWGQGLAREAAIASIDHAFAALGADRVVAITFPGNAPSWGLMERLGMTRRPECDYDDPRFPGLNPTIVYDIRPGELRR